MIEVSKDKLKVKIHFDGQNEKWDEWIEIKSDRLARLNSVMRRKNQADSINKNTD